MSDALYREFILTGEAPARAMWEFIKSNAKAFLDRKRPLRVIITEDEEDRLEEQIRHYWGYVIKPISVQVWIGGRQFSKEAWHEELATRFLPGREIVTPSGEVVTKRASIARGHIGVRAMAKFTKEVEAYAATELGVEFGR